MKRKIVMVANDVGMDRGSIMHEIFDRTKILSNATYSSDIVTLDDKINYIQIEQQLKQQNRIAQQTRIINIFDFFRDEFSKDVEVTEEMTTRYKKNRQIEEEGLLCAYDDEKKIARYFDNGQYIKFKRWNEDGTLRHVDYFDNTRVRRSREEYHAEGYLIHEMTYHPKTNQLNQDRFYTKNGFCFAMRWFNHETAVLQRIHLFEPQTMKTTVFTSQESFQVYFLNALCASYETKPFLICESPTAAPLFVQIDSAKAHRIFRLHTNPFVAPYTPSKKVRTAYETLIHYNDPTITLVVQSEQQQEQLLALDEQKKPIFVVERAVTVQQQQVKQSLNTVSVVSRFKKSKRLIELVKAFRIVVDDVADAQLHIYGDGALKADLEKLIKKLRLRKNVFLYPYTIENEAVLAKSLFTVQTATFSGQPLAPLMAMGQGVPVVTFDAPHMLPLFYEENQQAGVVVPNGDFEALAAAMTDLLFDVEKAQALGANAYAYVCQRHTFEQQYEKWQAVFDTLEAKDVAF